MMAAPLLAAGQALFKGPIESAKKGVNDIVQHRVDDAVSGIDDRLSGRHGRRHHRRYSDSSSESAASESKSSKPPKPESRKRPTQPQYRVESAKVFNIQLDLNVYPATLAGFMIELDISCPVQPDWPIRRVRVNHNNIYVANPHLFTLITFKTLREYHYIGQSSLFTMADECPFELPLARRGLVYLEDPYQSNCFRDANEVMSPYGLAVPYNPVSRFQLVVLPDGSNSASIAHVSTNSSLRRFHWKADRLYRMPSSPEPTSSSIKRIIHDYLATCYVEIRGSILALLPAPIPMDR
jgi:hypothetical protein